MSFNEMAKQKETAPSGSHQNYYLQIVPIGGTNQTVTVEIEDIIEALDMLFSAGNVFKAIVRMCKLRQDLGKPGSTKVYESQKTAYYSKRTSKISIKRFVKKLPWLTQVIVSKLCKVDKQLASSKSAELLIITITDPKRLDPYSFVIKDFIDSLQPTGHEAAVLLKILTISLIRQQSTVFVGSQWEVDVADDLIYHAEQIEKREKITVTPQYTEIP